MSSKQESLIIFDFVSKARAMLLFTLGLLNRKKSFSKTEKEMTTLETVLIRANKTVTCANPCNITVLMRFVF